MWSHLSMQSHFCLVTAPWGTTDISNVARNNSLTPSSGYQITATHYSSKNGIALIIYQRKSNCHGSDFALFSNFSISEDYLVSSVKFSIWGKRTRPALLFKGKEVIIVKPIKRWFGWFIFHTSFFQALVGGKGEATADKTTTTL